MLIATANDTGTGAITRTGSGQRITRQGLLEKRGMTVMDLNRCLHYLSLNPVLKFAAMSFSFYSSQVIGGTTDSTPISGSVLAANRSTSVSDSMLVAEEDEEGDEVEA